MSQHRNVYRPPTHDGRALEPRRSSKRWPITVLAITEILFGLGLALIGVAGWYAPGADAVRAKLTALLVSSLGLVVPGVALLTRWKHRVWLQLITAAVLAFALMNIIERKSELSRQPAPHVCVTVPPPSFPSQ